MLFYFLSGYLLYGAIITALAYARGEFAPGATIWRLLFSVLVEPLNVHYLSMGHWGNVPWSSAGKGALLLLSKVGATALVLYIIVAYLLDFFPKSMAL